LHGILISMQSAMMTDIADMHIDIKISLEMVGVS
jgi:hypothetical protein